MTSPLYYAGLLAATLSTVACNSPARAIRPIIHALDEDRYQAMKSAPVIVLAEIQDAKLVSGPRPVQKPTEVGGPMSPTIPLYLARISAKVLLTFRGMERGQLDFYSWVWASGQHGGPRLFHTSPGSDHILFLKEDGGYIHTVGDYPNYDVEVRTRWAPQFVSEWKLDRNRQGDLFERLAEIRIRIELATLQGIAHADWTADIWEWMALTSPFFIATKIDSYCLAFPNPFGQFVACEQAARFNGRCKAYRLAREIDVLGAEENFFAIESGYCEAHIQDAVQQYRSENWPLPLQYGWRQTPERRRMAMRFYASAMDIAVHNAACKAAASMPEARDIQECSAP